jgi:hypothetical protein
MVLLQTPWLSSSAFTEALVSGIELSDSNSGIVSIVNAEL